MTTDIILYVLLGYGTCAPMHETCPEKAGMFGFEASVLQYKKAEIVLSARHVSDITRGHDRGFETYMIEGRIEFARLGWK